MDDKERIEYIILEKQLSNTEFCAKANIAPATLSHILGGRSKPSLAILRGVVTGFPDLNPEWVLLGTGEMYRNSSSSSSVNENLDLPQEAMPSNAPAAEETLDVFGSMNDMFASSPSTNIYNKGVAERNAVQGRSTVEKQEKPQMNLSDIVRETLEVIQKPQRKIVEVRIFFDDGTYETFSPK